MSVPSNSRFSFYVRIKGLSIFAGGNRYNNKEIDICDLSYKEMTDLQYAVSLLPTMDTKTKVGMLIKLDSLIKAQEKRCWLKVEKLNFFFSLKNTTFFRQAIQNNQHKGTEADSN